MIGLGISILLARGLGKEQRGIYTLAVLLPELLVTFLNLGVASGTVFFISRKQTAPNQAIAYNINIAFWISLGSILIGCVLILLTSDTLFPNVPVSLLFLSLLLIPFLLLINYLNSIFQGIQDFRTFNIIGMVTQGIMLILVIIFVWIIPLSTLGAMISYLISDILGALLLLIILIKRFGGQPKWILHLNKQYIRQIMDYSIKSHLYNSITFLNYRVDNFILNRFAGPSPVGLYSISVGLSERLWIPSTAIGAVIFPRIASLDDGDSRREVITPLTTRFVLWISIIIAIFAAPLLAWLIPILYSTEYLGSIQPLLLLIPGTIVFNVSRILSNDIAGRGKPGLNVLISVIALVINIIANIILIPYFNSSGAALASTISYSAFAVFILIAYCRLSSVRWEKILFPQKSDFIYLKKYLLFSLQNLKQVIKP